MSDHTADHEFGADLGARYLAADKAERQLLLRQMWAGAADLEHTIGGALAAFAGGIATYPLPDGRRIAFGQRWRELDGPRRILDIEYLRPEPSGRVVAVCSATRPEGKQQSRRALLSADRFADRGQYTLIHQR